MEVYKCGTFLSLGLSGCGGVRAANITHRATVL